MWPRTLLLASGVFAAILSNSFNFVVVVVKGVFEVTEFESMVEFEPAPFSASVPFLHRILGLIKSGWSYGPAASWFLVEFY